MSDNPVSFRTTDTGIGIISVNNPPVNALSHAVRCGIRDTLSQLFSLDIQAVVLICDGETFIAGADISEFGKELPPPSLPEVVSGIENFPRPVVVAMHGNALGGGLEIAIAGHYRIASPGTRFGMPEISLGLLPGSGGTQRLPRLVGSRISLEMIATGKTVGTQEAMKCGLIDRVSNGDLCDDSLRYAEELVRSNTQVRRTGELLVSNPVPDDEFNAWKTGEKHKKYKALPAFHYIIDLIKMAQYVSLESGLAKERFYFVECRNSKESAAMRYVFFSERKAARIPNIPEDTVPRDIEHVAIIGSGTMGSGIAMSFANAKIPVTIIESSEEALQTGLQRISDNYSQSVTRGTFTQASADHSYSLIKGSLSYSAIQSVDLVIEAVYEDMDVKIELLNKLSKFCKRNCIIATNTSYLDVNNLAQHSGYPTNFVGMHFFSPANVMKLLEIVRGSATAPEVLLTVVKLAKKIGKVPVTVGVCHGFVGNRMLGAYTRQVQLLLLEGATPLQVDTAMESWGMKMGPLAVGDLAGIDIGYRARRSKGLEPHSLPEYDLPDSLVEGGRLGVKSGAGYYLYREGTRERVDDPEVLNYIRNIAKKWNIVQRNHDRQTIVDRLVLALITEGAKILDEGVAYRASDIDAIYINGYGFPPWRGGPMYLANELGLNQVLDKLRALEQETGDRFWHSAPLLERFAKDGRKLFD